MEDIMIKLRNMIVAVIAITSISIVSHADIGFGVTGSFATVEASGSDRDKTATADTSTRTGTASNVNALVGSVFANLLLRVSFVFFRVKGVFPITFLLKEPDNL